MPSPDIAIIGAGLTGLLCGRLLLQAGYSVVLVEKSRGLGGRVATRRLAGTCADHGARFFEVQGPLTQQWLATLLTRGIVQPWIGTPYDLVEGTLRPSLNCPARYGAPDGMTAIAKELSQGLEIYRGQRAATLRPEAGLWQIDLEAIAPSASSNPVLTASALALTIPTPQAIDLLHPLRAEGMPASLLTALQAVDYAPCITAIAAYDVNDYPRAAQLPWASVRVAPPSDLAWISLEHTKRLESEIPAVIVQSSAAFAEAYLEATDWKAIGQHLLHQAAQQLGPEGNPISWLEDANEVQMHRWRHALVRSPLKTAPLASVLPLPLACGGDWLWGQGIEAALRAGLDLADTVDQQLRQVGVPAAATVLGCDSSGS